MKTLLLCGYRPPDENELALGVGVKRGPGGLSLLDQRIVQLTELGHELICVVNGASSDIQLRHSEKLPTTELVFDTNEPGTLISNTRSGVFAAPGEAFFVLPLEVPPPAPAAWAFLQNEYGKVGFGASHAMLQTPSGQGTHYGFPLLLTRFGAKQLRDTPELRSLIDLRLKYLHLAR